jgi:hypothetical protein
MMTRWWMSLTRMVLADLDSDTPSHLSNTAHVDSWRRTDGIPSIFDLVNSFSITFKSAGGHQ